MLNGNAIVISYARGSPVVRVRYRVFESRGRFVRGNDELYEPSRGNRVDGLPRVASHDF